MRVNSNSTRLGLEPSLLQHQRAQEGRAEAASQREGEPVLESYWEVLGLREG